MKKKWIILAALLLAAVLFVPVPAGVYKDGGTRVFQALTYKVVKWNRLTLTGTYDETRIYFLPNNFKSLDDLWSREEPRVENSFLAKVLEINGSAVLVEALEDQPVRLSSDQFSFGTKNLEHIGVQVGDIVKVTFTGAIRESYPAQIDAVKWEIVKDLRFMPYEGQWLDRDKARKRHNNLFADVVITRIYENCFFVSPAIPMPYQIKINGTLGPEWCVGDQVLLDYDNTWHDEETWHVEADLIGIQESNWQPQPGVAYKPVIYLYPETRQQVRVELDLDGQLICTYPRYDHGWAVTADPDGTLRDEKGLSYNYLYWEGLLQTNWDMNEGFCIRGEDTAAFLEDALEKLGLNRREANEFIVYWLPLMEKNPYNLISFQGDAYTDAAGLLVQPAPDTVIRVFMTWKGCESFVQLPAQELTAPERTGFTVVEWGGTELN